MATRSAPAMHYSKVPGGRPLCGNRRSHCSGPAGYNCERCITKLARLAAKRAPAAAPQWADCVYYWAGGTEDGRWHEAQLSAYEAIRRGGRVAVYGKRSIGAPEGAPAPARFEEVLRAYNNLD